MAARRRAARYDKQYVRDWLTSTRAGTGRAAAELPDDVVAATRDRYVEAYERLTGRPLRLTPPREIRAPAPSGRREAAGPQNSARPVDGPSGAPAGPGHCSAVPARRRPSRLTGPVTAAMAPETGVTPVADRHRPDVVRLSPATPSCRDRWPGTLRRAPRAVLLAMRPSAPRVSHLDRGGAVGASPSRSSGRTSACT